MGGCGYRCWHHGAYCVWGGGCCVGGVVYCVWGACCVWGGVYCVRGAYTQPTPTTTTSTHRLHELCHTCHVPTTHSLINTPSGFLSPEGLLSPSGVLSPLPSSLHLGGLGEEDKPAGMHVETTGDVGAGGVWGRGGGGGNRGGGVHGDVQEHAMHDSINQHSQQETNAAHMTQQSPSITAFEQPPSIAVPQSTSTTVQSTSTTSTTAPHAPPRHLSVYTGVQPQGDRTAHPSVNDGQRVNDGGQRPRRSLDATPSFSRLIASVQEAAEKDVFVLSDDAVCVFVYLYVYRGHALVPSFSIVDQHTHTPLLSTPLSTSTSSCPPQRPHRTTQKPPPHQTPHPLTNKTPTHSAASPSPSQVSTAPVGTPWASQGPLDPPTWSQPGKQKCLCNCMKLPRGSA